ncbi:MAG TPA: hypothetical protein VII82_08315, partial [Polyangiaceae bacterium]
SLGAAADYNRALAHAPNDPHLLRIVAGMNRAERRGRLIGRAARGFVVVAGLAGLAFATVRLVRTGHAEAGPLERASPAAVTSVPTLPSASILVPSPPSSSSARAASSTVPSREPPRILERHVTLDLKPPMGVSLSIDGLPERGVSTGDSLALGTRAHTLAFSCPVCATVVLNVEASDRDTTLAVSVPVKPAILVIDGDVSRTYQLVEHPELVVRAGFNTIPLRSTFDPVTVRQIESGDSVSVRLEAAKTLHATFANP